MNLTNYERETIINFNEGEAMASVYTHNRALRRKLDKLAVDRPKDCKLHRVSHDGQAAEYYIPKRWIKIAPPRKMSESQRDALAKARQAANKAA